MASLLLANIHEDTVFCTLNIYLCLPPLLTFFKMNDQIKGEAMVMKNMPHMAQFVYDFYNQKINRLMSQPDGGRQTQVIYATVWSRCVCN